MPLLVNHTRLKSVRTLVANPFGGLIYVTCAPTNERGRLTSPFPMRSVRRCSPRATTNEDWKTMVETAGAPWGELAPATLLSCCPRMC